VYIVNSINSACILSTVKIVSYCRIYLMIDLISSLTTADGKQVPLSAWIGVQEPLPKERYRWPPQPRPSNRCWKIWRSCLVQILGANEDGVISVALPSITGVVDWPWLYSPSTKRLYKIGQVCGYKTVVQAGTRPARQLHLRFAGALLLCDDDNIPDNCLNVTVQTSNKVSRID
jgi:hypothetical protein